MVELSSRGRTYAMFAIVTLCCAFGSLSQTSVNSMMVAIGGEFGVTSSVTQWLTTIYMLVFGIAVPAVTWLTRTFNLRTVSFITIFIALAGSIVSFFAPSLPVLVVGRVLQAISAGLTTPLIQTVAMTQFPKGQNATAMGVSGVALGFAPNFGPTVGGLLVASWGWRSFFLLMIIFNACLVVATLLFIPRMEAPSRDMRLDAGSFILSSIGFGGVLLCLSNASNFELIDPMVWVPLIVGVIGVVAFVVRQIRTERQGATPLVTMRIFESRRYRNGFVALNFLFASFLGVTLVLPLLVMELLGRPALDAGIAFLPAMVAALVFTPLAGVLCDRIGTRPVVVGGSVAMIVGAVSTVVLIDDQMPLWVVGAVQCIRCAGVSCLISPLSSWAYSLLPKQIVVDGSAFCTMVRQACSSTGTALMMFAVTMGKAVGDIELGFRLGLGISMVFGIVMAAIVFVRVRSSIDT